MMKRSMENAALLIVDLQNDFCPGGALPITEGDEIVPVINRYIRRFRDADRPIYASRDWHPSRTRHFLDYGGLWPPHCIQGTRGAELHPQIDLPGDAIIVSKGMDPEEDSYSCFQACDLDNDPLSESLHGRGIECLWIGGLATDYCVKESVLDALHHGFRVFLLLDGIRGVNLRPHDAEKAIEGMVRAGADVGTLE